MYINATNGDSQDMDTALADAEGWRLAFNDATGAEQFMAVCGLPVDGTGWWTIPLTAPAGSSSLTDAANFSVTVAASARFVLSPASVTDNAILRGDGGGRNTQDSSVLIDDSGMVIVGSSAAAVQVEQRATGPTFDGTAGQFWVKNTSPSTPFFTQSDGTEIDLADPAVSDADAKHLGTPSGDGEVTALSVKTTPISTDILMLEDGATGVTYSMTIGSLPIIVGEAGKLVVNARSSAGTIDPGEVVYITGWATGSGVVEVDLARSDSAATMPSYGIAQDTITGSVTGHVVVSGEILSQVTTGTPESETWSEGDPLYVSTTVLGALTNVKPTGVNLIQKVGIVNRVHSSSGIIQIVGAGRTNDLPNIPEDYLWLGDSDGVPAETARAGIDTDATTHIAIVETGPSGNPHEVSLENLEPGTYNQLKIAVVDAVPVVVLPGASSVDNELAIFDGTTGALLQSAAGNATTLDPATGNIITGADLEVVTDLVVGGDITATGGTSTFTGEEVIVQGDLDVTSRSTFNSATTASGTEGIRTSGDLHIEDGDIIFSGTGGTVDGVDVSELSDIANMAQNTFAGRITASTGAPEELDQAEATSMLNVATTSLPGLGPARTGGASTDYLSADGTYSVPAVGGTQRGFPTQYIELPLAADDVRWFKTPVAITVQGIDASVTGSSPDADFTIYHAATRDAAGTVVHTADTITSTSGTGFTAPTGDDTIPAGNYVWTEIDVIAGTVDTLELTMHYTED
jgi:hypothetical protein